MAKKSKIQIYILITVLLIIVASSILLFCTSNNVIVNTVSLTIDKIKGNDKVFIEHNINEYSISDNNYDYPNQSNEEFANFRPISTVGIKKDYVYRGISVNSKINRSLNVKNLLESNQINCIIDLEQESITNNWNDTSTKNSVKNIFEAIKDSNGKIYICCDNGHNKTGPICALLESLRTTCYNNLENDYLKSYDNLCIDYDSNPIIREQALDNLTITISNIFNLTNNYVKSSNVNKYTKEYLLQCRLTMDDIETIAKKVSDEDI